MMRLGLLLVALRLTLLAPPSFGAEPPRPKPKVPEFVEMLGGNPDQRLENEPDVGLVPSVGESL